VDLAEGARIKKKRAFHPPREFGVRVRVRRRRDEELRSQESRVGGGGAPESFRPDKSWENHPSAITENVFRSGERTGSMDVGTFQWKRASPYT
jgi:hypothetical protein